MSETLAQRQTRHRLEIRRHELDTLVGFLPSGATLLELGTGAGRQAMELEARGFTVIGLDLPQGRYAGSEVRKVVYFDGRAIPLRDASVDAVVTFHVLEHVEDLGALLGECARVAKPGAPHVHVMPTATWRVLTIVTRYAMVLRALLARVLRRAPSRAPDVPAQARRAEGDPTVARAKSSLRAYLVPSRHGAHGSAWSEVRTFGAPAWRSRLRALGWTIEREVPLGLAYSGSHFCGERLGIAARRRAARVLGSSSRLYSLRPPRPVAG